MRSIYLFLTHPSAPPEDMTTLLTSLISLDPSFPHLPLLIEMFAALVNQLPSTSQSLQEWAQYIFQEKVRFFAYKIALPFHLHYLNSGISETGPFRNGFFFF